MAVTVLRSLGQHLHPIGLLRPVNLVIDPNLTQVDGPNNLTQYATLGSAIFQQSAVSPKYGKYCGKLTVSAATPYGVSQTFTVNDQAGYVVSYWISIPTNLASAVQVTATFFASDSTNIGSFTQTAVNGRATSGYVRATVLVTTPPGTASMSVNFVNPVGAVNNTDSFYLNGIQLEPIPVAPIDPNNPLAVPDYSKYVAAQFANGDMSGYVWAGVKQLSPTIMTQFPSAFHSFEKGALHGASQGMITHGNMYGPNVIPLQG